MLCLTLVLLLPYSVFADPAAPSVSFPDNRPIDTQMDLGLFGLLGGGMHYSIEGKSIYRYEDFKALIYPRGDVEASNLIREAEECHLTAWMIYVGGVVTGADIALNFKPVKFLGVDWVDRISTGAVTTALIWGAGAVFDNSAEARKFNAVQRYNRDLKKQEDAFLDFQPQVCLAPQGIVLGVGRDF